MNTAALLLSLILIPAAHATVEDMDWAPLPSAKARRPFIPLAPAELHARTQAVLAHFGAAEEESDPREYDVYQQRTTLAGVQRVLSLLDRARQFPRFARLDSRGLEAFHDRDGFSVRDAEVALSPSGEGYLSPALANLARARRNPSRSPLAGLKVAIDPGHMSTREWDLMAGKFVRDGSRYLSEGLLNLQTALLLKAEFERLGARVHLTREGHGAVTDVTYEGMDMRAQGKRELASSTLADWFVAQVSARPVGAALFAAIEADPNYRRLFSGAARYRYFFVNQDVDARVGDITDFAPDISLAIHYDSVDPPGNPNGVGTRRYSRVKTYVHGSVDPSEWASKDARRDVLHHVLDVRAAEASLALSKAVVDNMKSGLRLDYDSTGGGSSYAVAPGVFARNLYLTRKLRGHAHTYVECLHYNDPGEFAALLARDHQLVIAGQTTWYSARLRQVAFAIRDGVLAFVAGR